MRKLFLLRGIPACGKSTFLKINLKDIPNHAGLVISADDVRLMFSSCVYPKDILSHKVINPENDKRVWNLIHDIVKERLIKGYTTIVDATHCNVNSIDYYKSFCAENDITCYVVQFDEKLEECKQRNFLRPAHRQVPSFVLDRMFENLQTPVPSWCEKISPVMFENIFRRSNPENCIKTDLQPLDYDKFKQIVIFGDIHGCYEPLKQFFEKYPINNETKYIFVGDYEDRGIQNKEVFDFLLSHRKDGNFLFLKGNHTQHTFNYASNQPVSSREFRGRTAKQLEGFDKKELKKFCLRQGSFAYFRFYGQKFLVTHGGVPTLPNSFTNEKEIVNGVGKYEDSVIIDNMFRENNPDVITIHGHRNIQEVPLQDGLKTGAFNLEGQIEFGGCLRAVIISKEGITPVEIKNEVYRLVGSDEDIIEQLKNSRFIRQKELSDGITSYSFTKECFYDKRWDNLTEKARGLFCRGTQCVARSFDKFFNIGEKQTLEQIADSFVYPVTVWKKENGYLGIVSYDHQTNDLFVSSKSTNEGEYALHFKKLLQIYQCKNSSNTIYEELKQILKDKNVSIVFEVCDSEYDPHIVEYEHATLFILEGFENTLTQKTIPYDEIKDMLQSICDYKFVHFKKKERTLEDKDSFISFIKQSEPLKDLQIEGYVIEDSNQFRVKHKTIWYRFWKYVRNQHGEVNTSNCLEKFPMFEKELKLIEDARLKHELEENQFVTQNLIGKDVFSVIKFRKVVEQQK